MSGRINLTMDQLKVGLYIYLDLKWFEQPFAFGHFKIKSEEQIAVIRSLGVTTIRYSPALSNTTPAAPAAVSTGPAAEAAAAATAAAAAPDIGPALAAKSAMIARIQQQRAQTARITEAFADTARTIREIDQNLFSRPEQCVQQASALVEQIAGSILTGPELAIHVMGDTMGAEELYFHSLNVTILSMMIARDIKLPSLVVGTLGMGALFHDIGNHDIPARLLRKTDALTPPERTLCELHTSYGIEFARRLKLPPSVQTIIAEHHEYADGSGYPSRLAGEAIGLLKSMSTSPSRSGRRWCRATSTCTSIRTSG